MVQCLEWVYYSRIPPRGYVQVPYSVCIVDQKFKKDVQKTRQGS